MVDVQEACLSSWPIRSANSSFSLWHFKISLWIRCTVRCKLALCPVKGEEPEKEAAPAASVKKQLSAQENTAAVQPVKAAAVEVSGANIWHECRSS